MINPYGVQREYRLGLEELERDHGRQTGRLHEAGAERRRKGAAAARIDLMLSGVVNDESPRGATGLSRLSLAVRRGLRLVRLQPRKSPA